jgi:hypothetical protein
VVDLQKCKEANGLPYTSIVNMELARTMYACNFKSVLHVSIAEIESVWVARLDNRSCCRDEVSKHESERRRINKRSNSIESKTWQSKEVRSRYFQCACNLTLQTTIKPTRQNRAEHDISYIRACGPLGANIVDSATFATLVHGG